MSDLRFKVMENDIPSSFTCGERSIDALTRTAYNILVGDRLVGNCMLKVAHICDEEYYVSDHDYAALELSYLAIDSRLQRKGIGTKALSILTSRAREISDTLPIRFLVLDAFEDKVEWYKKAGFGEYPKRADSRPWYSCNEDGLYRQKFGRCVCRVTCIMEDSYGELWMHDTFGTRSGAEFL